MTNRKPRKRRAWWRRKRAQRWLGASVAALAVVIAVAVLALRGQSGGPAQYFTEPAPPFTLPTIAGEQVSLSEHLGRHNVLLFFNEGMGCAPCFDQIVDLEADWKRFEALDVELVSIMVDPLDRLKAEAEELGIKTIVAADEDKAVSNDYDAMEASMHPGSKPGHSFILVNKAGQIIWRRDWIGHGKPMYYEVDEIYSDVAERLERSG